ncbi:MAG: hypothetical protein ACREA0_13790, partial [bacterium]
SERRGVHLDRLVGAFVVEFLAEGVEAPLLGGAVARRWAGGLGFGIRCMCSYRPFCWVCPVR